MQDHIRKRVRDDCFNSCRVLHCQLIAETLNFSSVIKIKAGSYVVWIPLPIRLWVKEITCPKVFHVSESVSSGPTYAKYLVPNLQVAVVHGYDFSTSSQAKGDTETEDGKDFTHV
jgi:hypothetical protein